ncbi:MAG: type II toxin-antitoxin system RelE/ParE family toxin [Thermodesulfobacteriota bacterium]
MYEIELSRKAARFYERADAETVRRLHAAFDRLAADPFHHYSIKPLSGDLQGSFRLRVGDMRIVYSVSTAARIVFVEVIAFRGDVYKKWPGALTCPALATGRD